VTDNAGGWGSPLSPVFAVRRPDIIAHERKRLDMVFNLPLQRLKERHALLRTLAWGTGPKDLARTGVACGTEGPGAAALLVGLMPGGKIPRRGRRRRRPTTPRRHRGFVVDGQDPLVLTPWARGESDACSDGRITGGVPGGLGIQPAMVAPRCELLAGQHPPHGRHGEVRPQRRRDAPARACGASPWGKAAAQHLGRRTGEPPHGARDGGGTTPPWPRGPGRAPGHRGAGPESVSPTCERRSAGRRPPAPRGVGHGQRPP
jgi:hypothetical protein